MADYITGGISKNNVYTPFDELVNTPLSPTEIQELANSGDFILDGGDLTQKVKALVEQKRVVDGIVNFSTKTNSRVTDLNSVFSVEWAKTYQYMIKILDFSTPLQGQLVPAITVMESLPESRTQSINLPPYYNFEIPDGKGIPQLTMTLVDNSNCIVEKSLRAWLNQVCNGVTVDYLSNIKKDLIVYKLDYARNIVYTTSYKVVPKGEIRIDLNSSSSAPRELNISFSVLEYSEI